MGLDMYLTREIYIGSHWEHRQVQGQIRLSKLKETRFGDSSTAERKNFDINVSKVSCIVEQIAYWRKANHIHKWFVDNVQEGEDDCKKYWVDKEQLKQLYDTCQRVLENKKLANELLPRESGFFFGGQDYDDYYYEDIRDTMSMLRPYIDVEEDSDITYYYQSSW